MTDGETGFQDLRARLYDPTTGQFLSRDTYGGQSGNALSLNRYSYGNNDPTRLVDPSGHDAIQSLLSGLDCLKRIITGIPSAIQNNWDAIKTIGSYVLPLLPLIGSAYLLVSALVGHDPLTGRTLSSDEIHQDLLFGVVGVIFDSGAGSALKDAFSAGRAVDDLSTLTRALDEAGSGARDVTAAERTVSEGVADGAQDEARAINRAASEGADQSIPICRGTSRPAELAATRETGYAMSDAARTAYIEGRGAGESLDEAVQSGRSASEAADARQLTFWGS